MSPILLPKMNIENHQDNDTNQNFLLLVVRIGIEERRRTIIIIKKDHPIIETISVTIVPLVTIIIPVTTIIAITTRTISIMKELLKLLKLLETRETRV